MEEFDGWVRHDRVEFLFVLTGTIRLYTEFDEPTEMRRGDSAYYNAAMGHNVVSTSQKDAMMLWVTAIGNAGYTTLEWGSFDMVKSKNASIASLVSSRVNS
jgi:mannose-6-phosphate isomerase-like protein (cupin superfamily)